ncbi:MAG: hypothetical protein OXN23_02975 [Gammaproteobacteria bacterium]|nr:hypothetical protein [Gammaproteobacteria bacterium]
MDERTLHEKEEALKDRELTFNMKLADFQHQIKMEVARASGEAGQAALKSSFVLNGAASVALLAFIAHLATADEAKNIGSFSDSLSLFAIGALMAAIATGITYLTYHFFDAETLKNKYFSEYYPIPFVLASYALFVCGLVSTSTAFNQL